MQHCRQCFQGCIGWTVSLHSTVDAAVCVSVRVWTVSCASPLAKRNLFEVIDFAEEKIRLKVIGLYSASAGKSSSYKPGWGVGGGPLLQLAREVVIRRLPEGESWAVILQSASARSLNSSSRSNQRSTCSLQEAKLGPMICSVVCLFPLYCIVLLHNGGPLSMSRAKWHILLFFFLFVFFFCQQVPVVSPTYTCMNSHIHY